MKEPLAQRLRPRTLDEVCGQRHLLAPGQVFRRTIDRGVIPNMIFYGPSGVGKTTVASIIAANSGMRLYKLNGTTASTSDIKSVLGDIGTLNAANGILLYLDEIQYFNRKQQQSLLEFMENGKLTLIASTTENPYFYVFNAVLSRATVFEFKPVSPEEVSGAIRRAISILEQRQGLKAEVEEGVITHLAFACGGDVRKAINAVELLFSAAPRQNGTILLTEADAQMVAQRSAMRYDRDGDGHYDILSALHKSIRGSDPDAALHYLARLLEAGDLLSACRRILVIAAEDIGLAYPQAMPIVKACVDSAIFHDIISSAVVRWDEVLGHGSVSNEIDVMAARGVIPLFLSCKACDIKTEALNELAILRDRFGGKGAKAAIVTTEVCNAAARHRAAQLGIAVIDLEELKTGQIVHRLKVIMKTE